MKKTIYYWSPCLTHVGTIKSTLNSSIALAKYNLDYEVVMLNVFGEWSLYKKYLNERGVKVKNLTFNFKNFLPKYGFIQSRFSYILISLISFIPLLILLKKKKPDYIIVHLITSLPIILFNLFSFNAKLILRISGYPQLNYLRKTFWKFSSKKISYITCPTFELMYDLQNKNIFEKKKLSILYDAILNLHDFNKKLNDKSFLPPYLIPDNFFLSVGRLTKQKNYFYLLDEFKKLCYKYPNQKLLIVGDGELREKIEKSIKQLNLTKNVFLIGHTSNVYYFMKRATAFILSSLWEEVGFVIVEAAASNLPVISSDCKNGPKEFLSYGEGGFLFNSNKKQALYNSLLLFMNTNKKEILKKKLKAKKESLKFTMYRHQIQLKNLLN
jgi:glycosyltransferase involved in cell wall biosynthesis|tara:strand:+ start:8106 stop:9254 length:1149 start_codon:yes stop_codon:yes gene_type:complete